MSPVSQTIAEMVYVAPTHVDVFDLTDIPELCSELAVALKLIVKYQNYEVSWSSGWRTTRNVFLLSLLLCFHQSSK